MAKGGKFIRGTAPLRSACVAMTLASVLLSLGNTCAAGSPAASSTKQTRDEAVQAIPFDKLTPALRGKVQNTISKCSIFRRMPVQVTDCDPDMYEFFTRHPEVVVNIWETMGVSKITLQRTGENTFLADDGSGTRGTMHVMRIAHDLIVAYCDGSYDGPLVEHPLKASCVLVLRYGYVRETNGRYYMTSRLDTFIHIDSVGVELLAKTFSPLITKTSDYNFVETCAFVGNVSRTSETNPQAIARIAQRLRDVDDETRNEFTTISSRIAEKATTNNGDRLASTASHSARAAKSRTR